MARPTKGKWYVKFPTYRYAEDVKKLAAEAGLKLVDARFDEGDGAKDAPKLTLKPEYKPAEPAKPAKSPKASESTKA